MTSKTYYFQKPQLEIEQGQIPNNSFDTDQLSLKGSANNNIKLFNSKHLKNNHNDQLIQTPQHKRQWVYEQNEYQDCGLAQKNSYKQFQHSSRSWDGAIYTNSKNDFWSRSNNITPYYQKDVFNNSMNKNNYNNYQNNYFSNKNKNYGNNYQTNMMKTYDMEQSKYRFHHTNTIKNQIQFDSFQLNYNHDHKIKQQNLEKYKNISVIAQPTDPRRRNESSIQINKKIINIKNEQKIQSEWSIPKDTLKAQIEHHKSFFQQSDWQRLLFIIQEIILDNNNAIRQLWNFIDSYSGKRKYQKGLRIFMILDAFGMDQVFDKLIIQEQKFKRKKKQKQTKIKSLIFGLVRKID